MVDPQQNWFAKTVSETIEVQKQVDTLREEYARFGQLWDGLTWLLARKADITGYPFRGYRLYKHPGIVGDRQSPSLTVLFEVKDYEVEIVAIRISDPECNFYNIEF